MKFNFVLDFNYNMKLNYKTELNKLLKSIEIKLYI